MKVSTFIFALLFIGVVITVVLLMTNDASDYYSVEVNTSSIQGKYDYSSTINESVDPIITSLDKISDQENGWLSKVGAGFTGIIAAVLLLPKLVWTTFAMGGNLITTGLSSLSVPAFIISTILIGLTIWGVFRLIAFFQRWEL